MKRRLKIALVILGCLVAIGGVVYFGYWQVVSYRIKDFASVTHSSTGENIDVLKARASLHRVLSWPVYGYHDAFLLAGDLGDESTIPLLIAALGKEGDIDPEAKYMDCSRAHLLSSLRKLTGANPGVNKADWIQWKGNETANNAIQRTR